MWTRLLFALFAVALATPCYADAKGIADIADGIASYRLSAQFCHWPIPANIDSVLRNDELHFSNKNPDAFKSGVRSGTERFYDLVKSDAEYCSEIRDSRGEMTKSLEQRVK